MCHGYEVAPDLFLTPVLHHCTDHCGFLGTIIDFEPFTDLDSADDVALLSEILPVLLLVLEIIDHETKFLGIQID